MHENVISNIVRIWILKVITSGDLWNVKISDITHLHAMALGISVNWR